MAGVNIVGVPYKSAGAGTIALLAGEVHVSFAASPASALPHVKAGKLNAIAVGSLEPSAMFPGLPTVAETLPGYESVLIQGLFASGKIAPAI